MYCTKCGTKNDDDAKFCAQCRNPLGGSSSSSSSGMSNFFTPAGDLNDGGGGSYTPSEPSRLYVEPTPVPKSPEVNPSVAEFYTPKKVNKGNNIFKIIGVVAIIAVIAIVVMVSGILKPGCKKTVDNYLKAFYAGDADAALKVVPESYIDAKGESTLKKGILQTYELLKNYKVSYEITSVEEVSEIELLDIKSDYEKSGENIKDAKKVSVELTVTDEKDTATNTVLIYAIKIKGSWYIDAYNSYSSYS